MLVIAVSPIIAPTLGGYLIAEYGWHSVFIVLTCMAVMVLIATHFVLQKSLHDTSYSLSPGLIARNYLSVLKTPQFYTYAFTGAIAASGLYAYISGSPYVFIELFKVTEKQYGWIFAIAALGLIIASQVNSLVLKKYSSQQITKVALCCQVITGILLFTLSSFQWLNVYTTVLMICMFLSCQGFIFPNTSALSMAPFGKNAGSASALMGSIQLSFGAIASVIVSALSNNTAMPMTGVMAACSLTSLCILLAGKRSILFKATEEDLKEETIESISRI
jgi:DHA1 family bicyclomycin/chloramphenicol resistance-like MFS transporter